MSLTTVLLLGLLTVTVGVWLRAPHRARVELAGMADRLGDDLAPPLRARVGARVTRRIRWSAAGGCVGVTAGLLGAVFPAGVPEGPAVWVLTGAGAAAGMSVGSTLALVRSRPSRAPVRTARPTARRLDDYVSPYELRTQRRLVGPLIGTLAVGVVCMLGGRPDLGLGVAAGWLIAVVVAGGTLLLVDRLGSQATDCQSDTELAWHEEELRRAVYPIMRQALMCSVYTIMLGVSVAWTATTTMAALPLFGGLLAIVTVILLVWGPRRPPWTASYAAHPHRRWL